MVCYLLRADAQIVRLDDDIAARLPNATHPAGFTGCCPHLNAAEDIPHLSARNAPHLFGGADEHVIPVRFRKNSHISRICTLGNAELGGAYFLEP